MDFREYAAKEASELTTRLTQAATAAAERAAAQVRDEEQKVADALRAQLQTAVDQKSAVAASLKESETEAARLRAELKSTVDQKSAVAASLKEAETEAARLRAELNSATERVEVTTHQLDEARKTADKLEAARAAAGAARDEQAAARKTAEADLQKTREAAELLRKNLAGVTKDLEAAAAGHRASEASAAEANSQSQAAEAKLEAVTDLLKKGASRLKTVEQAQQQQERTIHDLQSQLQAARAAPAAAASAAPPVSEVLEALITGFQALAAATTIAGVFKTLVEQMAGQFPRVALFRMKKGHLLGEHQIGFDLSTDIGKIALPLGMESLPVRAASSGRVERLAGEELKGNHLPFAGTPTSAIAFPLVVAGETLAIVYTDDAGAPKRGHGADDARCADAMRQYAVAVLMRLNNELKALAELQKYAASLLHEMEQMYDADVESGLAAADLQKRLASNLDYARSIYRSRTAHESPDTATLIDDEIAALVDARRDRPFGSALAAVAGLQGTRSAAEAS
jgi:hypothetical protein